MPEPLIPPALIAATNFQADFRRFLSVDLDTLSWLNGAIEQQGSFEATPTLLAQATERGFNRQTVLGALKMAGFIYEHSRHRKIDVESATAEIKTVAALLNETVDDSKLPLVAAIITRKESVDRNRAIRSTLSVGPSILDRFLLTVDARSVSDIEKGDVIGQVVLIIGRVGLGDEAKDILFRVTDEQLREMRDDIDRALREFAALKSQLGSGLLE